MKFHPRAPFSRFDRGRANEQRAPAPVPTTDTTAHRSGSTRPHVRNDLVLDRIRKLADNCTGLHGFLCYHHRGCRDETRACITPRVNLLSRRLLLSFCARFPSSFRSGRAGLGGPRALRMG